MADSDWEINSFDTVGVLRSHIEKWLEPIRWAHGYQAALDLSHNYREGRPNLALSKLTRRLEDTIQQMEGYLNTENDTNE